MKIKRLILLVFMLLAMAPNHAVAGDTIVCTTAQIDSLVDAKVREVLAGEIERAADVAAHEKYIQHDNEMKNRYTWMGILIALAGAFIPYLVNKGYEKRLEKKEEEVDRGLQDAEKKMLGKLARIAVENKRKISEEIATRTAEIDKTIKDHDKKLKEMSDKVEAMVKKAKESEDKSAESAKLAKASELFSQALVEKDNDKAIELFKESIDNNPNVAEAYFNRGVAYYNKCEYDNAIKDYSKAIEINPNFIDAYNNRAVAYCIMGENDMAIKDYDEAIRITPNDNDGDVYNNRGIAYYNKGEYDKAITDYDKAIRINPNNDSAYNNKAVTLYDLKKYEDALPLANKAIELNEGEAEYYDTRCDIFLGLDNIPAAMEDARKGLEIAKQKGQIELATNIETKLEKLLGTKGGEDTDLTRDKQTSATGERDTDIK